MADLENVCQGIFKIVNNSEPYLQEFDVIDLRPNETEYLFEENCLVINKIVLKRLYFYLKEQFLKRNERNLSIAKREQVSLLILLVNPQFSSVWSQRKELVNSNFIAVEHEFRINSLILDKNVKSEHGYMHRRWLVKRFEVENVEDFVGRESEMVYRLSRKIKSNYYCWSYLNWVIEHFKDKLVDRDFMIDFLDKHRHNVLELSVSDNCVFHFRLNLLKALILETKVFVGDDLVNLVVNEIRVFDDLLIRYPKYQTVWNYRKYFYRMLQSCDLSSNVGLSNSTIRSLFCSFKLSQLDNDQNSTIESTLVQLLSTNKTSFSGLLQREVVLTEFIKSLKSPEEEKTLINNYANLHDDFLKKFFIIE